MPALDPDVVIRPITRDQAEAWRTLRLTMLRDHPTAFLSSYEEWRDRDLAAFAAQISEDGVNVLFGAFMGDELNGSAGFRRSERVKERHKGTMFSVYVEPAMRGRGLGEALVQAVIDHAGKHVEVLFCGVGSHNPRAGGLYRRLGFVGYGVEPKALRVDGEDYDEDLLIMSLGD